MKTYTDKEKIENWNYIHDIFHQIIDEKETFPWIEKLEKIEFWFLEQRINRKFVADEALLKILSEEPTVNSNIKNLSLRPTIKGDNNET